MGLVAHMAWDSSQGKYEGENILIHEFSHIIHMVGVVGAEPDFDDRLTAMMNNARNV
jgi:alpha-glucosidase